MLKIDEMRGFNLCSLKTDSSKQRMRLRKKLTKDKTELEDLVKTYNMIQGSTITTGDFEKGVFPWTLLDGVQTGTALI